MGWDRSSGTGNGMALGQASWTAASRPSAGGFRRICSRGLKARTNSRAQVNREGKLGPPWWRHQQGGWVKDKGGIAARRVRRARLAGGRPRLRHRRPGTKVINQGFHDVQRGFWRRSSAQRRGKLSEIAPLPSARRCLNLGSVRFCSPLQRQLPVPVTPCSSAGPAGLARGE